LDKEWVKDNLVSFTRLLARSGVKFFVQRAALNSKFALLRAKILRKTCPTYHLHVPNELRTSRFPFPSVRRAFQAQTINTQTINTQTINTQTINAQTINAQTFAIR
jgi:hypothetical protein